MTLTFFGSLGDRFGRSRELALPDHVRTVRDLRAFLGDEEVLGAEIARVAVDEVTADEDQLVTGARCVDFLPPVSGG